MLLSHLIVLWEGCGGLLWRRGGQKRGLGHKYSWILVTQMVHKAASFTTGCSLPYVIQSRCQSKNCTWYIMCVTKHL